MTSLISTKFRMFEILPWLADAGYWQLPNQSPAPSNRDAFMLGGNGRLSARMGMQPAYSTIDRILGPEFDSYGYYQNNTFRKLEAGVALRWPHMLKSWISIDWPYTLTRTWQRLWRVRSSAIVCTIEELQAIDEDGVWARGIELATLSFILPDQPVLIRLLALRNGGWETRSGIRLVVDSPPDLTWPDTGHNSIIQPLGQRLLEQVTEYELDSNPGTGRNSSERVERVRLCLRGLVGGQRRGFQTLAGPAGDLEPGDETMSLAYLVVSPDGTLAAAEEVEKILLEEIESRGVFAILEGTYDWWQQWRTNKLSVRTPEDRVADFLDAALVAQKQAQHERGGIMVGDDYTSSFVRDCNGSHLLLGAAGYEAEVARSMDFFFRQDAWGRNFQNSYRIDRDISDISPGGPYWYEQAVAALGPPVLDLPDSGQAEPARNQFMTPGDVPNFRVLWYWWRHLRTGDLVEVEQRWTYLTSLIRLQRFEQTGFLNGYSQDETYGIGPAGALRKGASADNTFIALAAVQAVAELAKRLNKVPETETYQALAQKILQAIETTYWLEDEGYYAMRLTSEGELDRRPCTPGLLRPLWVGCQGLDPERVASSVDYVLRHLRSSPGFLRIIPGDFWMTPGHFPGYLLANLCKLDHPEIDTAFSDLLEYVNPGGTCAEYYLYQDGRPRADIHRSRNWETGINAAALLFYLTGFEPDAILDRFDLSPHLPPRWENCRVEGLPIGRSQVDLELNRKPDEISYRISLRGSQSYAVRLRCPMPNTWTSCQVSINDQPVEIEMTTNRYGLRILRMALAMTGGETVQVQMNRIPAKGQ
jgi:hypothetical protein